MVGHLFQNYDTIDIRAVFFPRILAIIPATRYTWVLVPRILAFFPALWVQTRIYIYMRTKKSLFMRYKQACGIWGHGKSSFKRHRIYIISRKPPHVRWS